MIFFVIYYKNDKISQFSFIFSIRPPSQILFLLILISFTCSPVLPYSLQLLFLFFINYSLQSYQLTNPNIPHSKLHSHRQFKMISLAFYLLSSILPNSLVLYSFFFSFFLLVSSKNVNKTSLRKCMVQLLFQKI